MIKIRPLKKWICNLVQKVLILKNIKKSSLIWKLIHTHIKKRNIKKLPFHTLGHEFCYFLKSSIWPRVWWKVLFWFFLNFLKLRSDLLTLKSWIFKLEFSKMILNWPPKNQICNLFTKKCYFFFWKS